VANHSTRQPGMEILMLANKMPYPPKDGGSIATLSMAKSFAALGHKVTMLAMNTSKHYCRLEDIPGEITSSIEFHSVDVNTDISFGAALHNFLFRSIPYNAARFITGDFDSRLAGLLKSRKFDVIQMEGLYLGPYIRTIRKHSRALVSMRAHNIEHEIWQRTAALSSGVKKFYLANLAKRIYRFETSMLNNYDVLVPITGRDAEGFLKLGCKIPVHVAPTGINSQDYKPDFVNFEFPSLFHLGALDWPPNQEGLKWFFAKVWPYIIKEFPGLEFYLAGRNAPAYFSKMSEPNVKFLGEVDDAHDFVRSKAVMIVPILSGSGLRIKIIEGMALGKAIITTSIGKEGIESTHMKNMMIADDPIGFTQAVKHLLSGKEKVIEMGRQALDFVNQYYDNIKITESLADFYRKHLN
jgi:polysaccharide biosynthesis protein PslH